MAVEVIMPKAGSEMEEGEIVQWFKNEGDHVEAGEVLLEIVTDKVNMEVEADASGTLLKILAQAGDVVPVVQTIAWIGEPGEAIPGATSTGEVAPAETVVEKKVDHTPVKEVEVIDYSGLRATPAARAYAREKGIDLSKVKGTGAKGRIHKDDVLDYKLNSKVKISPLAARIAQIEGINTESIAGTGPNGKIMKADVLAVLNGTPKAEPAKPFVGSAEREERVKLTPMRKAISKAMVNSKHTAPHVTLHDQVEVSKLWDHRKKFKDVAAAQGTKLTFLPYVVKALAVAMKKFPVLNASIDDASQEIVYKNYINIGIATDTDLGLFVPNIKDANTKSMFGIADEINALAAKAHEGKLTATDMGQGTITISNIGSVGGGWFTPVINYPEVAILGVGTIVREPVINENDEIVIGRNMKLSLSFDHRIVDGATAQKAMNELKRLLADPELLLMEA